MAERISQTILFLVLLLAADRASAQENACDGAARAIDISSIDALDAEVIFFGELHGNKETPAAFLATICQHLEQKDGDVRVALEFGTDIHSSLDRFMESDGGSEAVQEFLRHPFWQRNLSSPDDQRGISLPDGRSSVAMLNLVEALRELRVANWPRQQFAACGWRAKRSALSGGTRSLNCENNRPGAPTRMRQSWIIPRQWDCRATNDDPGRRHTAPTAFG